MTISTHKGLVRTVRGKKLAYLVSLEKGYKEMGYQTRLNGRENVLEIYEENAVIRPTLEEQEAAIIEKWAN
jgi:hypothetical protein